MKFAVEEPITPITTNEPPTEKPPYWMVLHNVTTQQLEEQLNAIDEAGYFVYKITQDTGVTWVVVCHRKSYSQVPGIRRQLERIGNLLANNGGKLAKKIVVATE
jgi:hypothetical protein